MAPDTDRAGRQAMHAAAFDRIGENYDEAFPHKEGQLAAGEWLIDRLRPGAQVLDVGCGTGRPTARQLVDAGLDVTGIDISDGMLTLARKRVPEANLLKLDSADIDESLGSFDAITDFFSLLMFPRDEIPWMLQRYRDLLIPGGYYLLGMIEEDLDWVPIIFLGNVVQVSCYPRGELRSIVTAAGFEVLDLRVYAYTSPDPQAWPEIQLFLYCRRDDR